MHSWLLQTARWLIFSGGVKSILCLLNIGFSSSSLTLTKPDTKGRRTAGRQYQQNGCSMRAFHHTETTWHAAEPNPPECVMPMLAVVKRPCCCALFLGFCESSYSSSIDAMVERNCVSAYVASCSWVSQHIKRLADSESQEGWDLTASCVSYHNIRASVFPPRTSKLRSEI